MLSFIRSFSRDERGVSALEYAILAGIVVAALVVAGGYISSTSTGIPAFFNNIMSKINTSIGS